MWCKEWGGEIYFGHGTRESKVVMILMKNQSDIKVLECKTGNDRGSVVLEN